jgi:hypothetical protein
MAGHKLIIPLAGPFPEPCCDCEWIDVVAHGLPPLDFTARTMQLPMMSAA